MAKTATAAEVLASGGTKLEVGKERPVDATYEGHKAPAMKPRDAATLIIVRKPKNTDAMPEVLLGCRDAGHAFMPNRYVFPGGRVDPADARVPVATPLRPEVDERLRRAASAQKARALAVAAVRETFEETGLIIGEKWEGTTDAVDKHWQGFLDQGLAPALHHLDYIARAVTPPGRPRRFNARFLMTDAEVLQGSVKDSSELGDIRWVRLDEAQKLPLPTITGLILGEVGRLLREPPTLGESRKIPLFKTIHRKHMLLEE
ncbi:MAG: NUDIX domain-containing protein [Alphaproteobacteria bacterium]|nr:NUDIX domain-containing protein [Alphaproteobacteria bacterium]